MARTNYSFKKRQKELKRQKKREEKLQRRLEKKTDDADGISADGNEAAAPEASRVATDQEDIGRGADMDQGG
jgi:hypothetical protein